MTDPFDYDGLTAHIRAIRTHDDAYNALRERIEAAFVPIEHHTAVITDHDELLQREIARAEAAEAAFVPVEDIENCVSVSVARADEATARAEAAEARVKALEAALGDLLSWFPQKPSPPEWRLRAGERGADDAVEAARAALGGEHDK